MQPGVPPIMRNNINQWRPTPPHQGFCKYNNTQQDYDFGMTPEQQGNEHGHRTQNIRYGQYGQAPGFEITLNNNTNPLKQHNMAQISKANTVHKVYMD